MSDIQTLTEAYNGLSPEEKAQFNKDNGLVLASVYGLFIRTDVVVTTPILNGDLTVKELYNLLAEHFEPADLHIDTGLKFDNIKKGNNLVSVTGYLDKFNNELTHAKVISEGKMWQNYLQVDYLQGILLAIELVKARVIVNENKGVYIYLNETISHMPCFVHVLCSFGNKPSLYICTFDPKSERPLPAGNGVLSSI